MYLLSLEQGLSNTTVGLFENAQAAQAFVESIPFVQKRQEPWGMVYALDLNALPDYYPVTYKGWVYVLSRFSFFPQEGEVCFVWSSVHCWDTPPSTPPSFCPGHISIDGYGFEVAQAKEYIAAREALVTEGTAYFTPRGCTVSRACFGSQDGEFLQAEGGNWGFAHSSSIVCILDPQAVALRAQYPSFVEFVKAYWKNLGE